MLNAIPDTRNRNDRIAGFLTPNDIVTIDDDDEHELVSNDDKYQHELYNMDQRRQSSSSIHSESSSSIGAPPTNPTADTAQRTTSEDIRGSAIRSHTPWLRLLAECLAELIGTAILVLFGCSGIAQYTLSRGTLSSFLSVNFAFGLGAMIAVYVAGPVSGAHINPAVSIAMLSLRSITPLQCLSYIIAQFIGAFIAAGLVFGTYFDAINQFDHGVRQVTGIQATAGIFGTLPAQGVSQISLFFDQILSTALLLIGICALSNKRNKLVANALIPLAVGFIIVAIGVAFGYNCGFPINPARDFGPRLFTLCVGYGSEVFSVGNYYFWIPLIGPIFGGIIGAWVYHGYSKLMKIHIGEDDREIARARYQVDVQNVTRM
ncbi:unnamed protein product [Rotaria sordida]|uniref:Aquaporin n=1 Tax=Rotaria sordida TaxID=392033 RepID=A0A814L639_9BILA|nr:unnamed protein product [Rotaria sordida]CAF1060726.1 unnamed protein product [Rotaria sordida]